MMTTNGGSGGSTTFTFSIMATVTTTVVVGLVTVLRQWRNNILQKKPFENLPMPPVTSTVLGHLSTFARFFKETCVHPDRQPIMAEWVNEYGQVGIWLGPRKTVLVTHAEDAQTVLTAEYFRKGAPFMAKHGRSFLGPKNIGFLHGREWRKNRSAIIRSLSPSSTLENSRRAMLEVANIFVDSCKGKIGTDKYIVSPIESYMKMITIDIFAKSSLDVDLGCTRELQPSPIAIAFDFLLDELTTRILDPFNPVNFFYSLPTQRNRKHKRERSVVRRFLEGLIHERREQLSSSANNSSTTTNINSKQDVLSNLIQVENETATENTGDDQSIDQTLDDTLMALLFAGYDTTSITLTYAFWCVSQDPEVEAKCLEEIRHAAVVATSGASDKDGLDPNDLLYCRAVMLETLRLYPPAGLTTRFLTKPITLSGGLTVPKGSAAMVYIEYIQRNERHFPMAEKFIPERWVQRNENDSSCGRLWEERFPNSPSSDPITTIATPANTKSSIDPSSSSSLSSPSHSNGIEIAVPAADRSAFLAFSAGGRSCPGMKFALQESVLVLATLLLDLKFETVDGYVLHPVRKGLIQHPDDGLPMKISLRSR
jgi:cytochrome P450